MRVINHFMLWCLGLAEPEALTTEAERKWLARYAAGRKRLVEIGVWHGVTTCVLRSVMAPDGLLFAVDLYPVGRLGFSAQMVIARSEVAKIPNGSVRWLRLTGAEAGREYAKSVVEPVDFAFIDGDHSYEGLRGDWLSWSPLVAQGGIIALHDSCSSNGRQIDDAGGVAFTRDVILRDQRFELLETVDTLSVLRRRSGT